MKNRLISATCSALIACSALTMPAFAATPAAEEATATVAGSTIQATAHELSGPEDDSGHVVDVDIHVGKGSFTVGPKSMTLLDEDGKVVATSTTASLRDPETNQFREDITDVRTIPEGSDVSIQFVFPAESDAAQTALNDVDGNQIASWSAH